MTDQKAVVRERIARRIVGTRGDIRRGRRVLRSVQRAFVRCGGQFEAFRDNYTQDAMMFGGIINGQSHHTYITGIEQIENCSPRKWALVLEARLIFHVRAAAEK